MKTYQLVALAGALVSNCGAPDEGRAVVAGPAVAASAAVSDVEPAARLLDGAYVFGAPNAERTIVVFTDFACPYSARLDLRLRELTARRPEAKVVIRHRPLAMHRDARLAARAAIAAEAQGKLDAYARVLFERQEAVEPAGAHGRASLLAYADRLGLDRARFERDLDAPETEARIVADEAWAVKLRVRGTPTSFIDDRRIEGAQPADAFETALGPTRIQRPAPF